jgi:CBS domain-containing protein
MFGGVATLRGEPQTPGADFRIAAVGPATSIGLGVGFGAVWLVLSAAGLDGLSVALAGWLASINIVLAVFNLIPGAPLDGGRILRAALWHRGGDRNRAATTATSVGQMVAYGLVGLGLLDFLAGNPVGGLWMMMIGWFVLSAARAEYAAIVTESFLRGMTVGDIMSAPVETGSSELTVQDFVSRCVLGGRHSAYPVVGARGEVEGLVTLEQLRRVPPAERGSTPVRAVAVPLARVAAFAPADPAEQLLTRVTRESGNRALVFDRDRLVGIVTPADVTRVLETHALLPRGSAEWPAAR